MPWIWFVTFKATHTGYYTYLGLQMEKSWLQDVKMARLGNSGIM